MRFLTMDQVTNTDFKLLQIPPSPKGLLLSAMATISIVTQSIPSKCYLFFVTQYPDPTENTQFNTLLIYRLGACMYSNDKKKCWIPSPESYVTGAVTGLSFMLIASVLSSQSAFEVGTKFNVSWCFILFLSNVLFCLPKNCSSLKSVLHAKLFCSL